MRDSERCDRCGSSTIHPRATVLIGDEALHEQIYVVEKDGPGYCVGSRVLPSYEYAIVMNSNSRPETSPKTEDVCVLWSGQCSPKTLRLRLWWHQRRFVGKETVNA